MIVIDNEILDQFNSPCPNQKPKVQKDSDPSTTSSLSLKSKMNKFCTDISSTVTDTLLYLSQKYPLQITNSAENLTDYIQIAWLNPKGRLGVSYNENTKTLAITGDGRISGILIDIIFR